MLKNGISKKYALILFLTFPACTFQKIKNAPELPKSDQPLFSYEEAVQKEKMLLTRAKIVKFISEIDSK